MSEEEQVSSSKDDTMAVDGEEPRQIVLEDPDEQSAADDGGAAGKEEEEDAAQEEAASSLPPPPPEPEAEFAVGDLVMVVGNDGILHERKVAEVSIRSIKRQKRPFYRLQCTLNSRKKGRSEEWFDGETVQAHSPEALEEVDRIEREKAEQQRLAAELSAQKSAAEAYARREREKAMLPPAPVRSSMPPTISLAPSHVPQNLWNMIFDAFRAYGIDQPISLAHIQQHIITYHVVDHKALKKDLTIAVERAVGEQRVEKTGRNYRLIDVYPDASAAYASAALYASMTGGHAPAPGAAMYGGLPLAQMNFAPHVPGYPPGMAMQQAAMRGYPGAGGGGYNPMLPAYHQQAQAGHSQNSFAPAPLPPDMGPMTSLGSALGDGGEEDDGGATKGRGKGGSKASSARKSGESAAARKKPSPKSASARGDGRPDSRASGTSSVGNTPEADDASSSATSERGGGRKRVPKRPRTADDEDDERQRKAEENATKRKQDLNVKLEKAAEARRAAENDMKDKEEVNRGVNEVKKWRRKFSSQEEIVNEIKAMKEKEEKEMADDGKRRAAREARMETHFKAKEDALLPEYKEDLEVIVSESRKKIMQGPRAGDLPAPTLLTSPSLPPRALADLLEIVDFVRQHAEPLSLTPFPLIHLLTSLNADIGTLGHEFRAVPGPLPSNNSSSNRKAADAAGGTEAFFVQRCLLSFLRILLSRNVATGEALEGEETGPKPVRADLAQAAAYRWSLVRHAWGELLNPLTLPEVLRRYFAVRDREKSTITLFSEENGYCPFGSSFQGFDELLAGAATAMKTAAMEELKADQQLALLKSLCEDLQESKAIQDFMQSKQEKFSELYDKKLEVEKEMRKIQRELKKAQQAQVTALKESAGNAASEADGESKDAGDDSGSLAASSAPAPPITKAATLAAIDTPEIKALRDKGVATEGNLKKATEALEKFEKEFGKVKLTPLGEDRFRNQYWYFADEPRLYVHLRSPSVTGLVMPFRSGKVFDWPSERATGGEWAVYTKEEEINKLLEALCQRSSREGQLLKNLQAIKETLCADLRKTESMRAAVVAVAPPVPATAPSSALSVGTSSISDSTSSAVTAVAKPPGPLPQKLTRSSSAILSAEGSGVVPMEVDQLANGSIGPSDKENDDGQAAGTEEGGTGGEDASTSFRRSQRARKPVMTTAEALEAEAAATAAAMAAQNGGVDDAGLPPGVKGLKRSRSGGARSKKGLAGSSPAEFAALRQAWRLSFDVAGDLVDCLRHELLSVEKDLWDVIDDTTMVRIIQRGSKDAAPRQSWQTAVKEATHFSHLVGPLLDLECLFARSLGFEAIVDEALKQYAELNREARQKRRDINHAKGRGGRRGKSKSPLKIESPQAKSELKTAEAGESEAAAMEAAAQKAEKEEDEEEEEGDEDDDDDDDEEDDEAALNADADETNASKGGNQGSSSDEEEDEDDEEEEEEAAEEEEEAEEQSTAALDIGLSGSSAGAASSTATGPAGAGGAAGKNGRKRMKPSSRSRASTPFRKKPKKDAIQVAGAEGLAPGGGGGDEDDEEASELARRQNEEAALANKELALMDGPLGKDRQAWIDEVREVKTPSALALCVYAFTRRVDTLLSTLQKRIKDVRKGELAAKKSIKSDAESGQIHIVTRELPQVVWARLPRGPYWPAVMHVPYHHGLRKLLKESGHSLIRFVGETPLYHLRGGSNAVLDFADDNGKSSVQVLKKGRSMGKALKVAWVLYNKWEEEKKSSNKKEEEEKLDEDDDSWSDIEGDVEEPPAPAAAAASSASHDGASETESEDEKGLPATNSNNTSSTTAGGRRRGAGRPPKPKAAAAVTAAPAPTSSSSSSGLPPPVPSVSRQSSRSSRRSSS